MSPRMPTARLTTPAGIAHFPYVTKPNTEGVFADGKYSISVSFPADDPFVEVLNAKIQELMAEHWGKRIPRKATFPVRDVDGNRFPELAGRVLVRAKSAAEPVVVDADKKPLPEGHKVCHGDTVRVALVLAVFETSVLKGVTSYLEGVQLLESTWQDRVDAMFD